MTYDIVSFDLDGTLIDTASEIAEAVNRTLDEYSVDRRPAEEITALIGNGTRELMLKLLARLFLDKPGLAERVHVEDVLQSFDRHYALTVGSSGVPYAGAREALAQLKAAGIKLACSTNKELRHARAVLRANRLSQYFDLVVGGDSLEQKKPHRAVLEHVVQTLGGRRERAAHVGDSRLDVEAARNAGVTAWAVPYGYNAGQPIEESNPDRLFRDLSDLAEFVLGGRPNGFQGTCGNPSPTMEPQ
jgi:phosphoglycolate phosphatase